MEETVHQAGALGALGVDPILFVAQLVNFAIVFFVMWKWVYTPLMKTLDERTARIEKGLKDAEAAAGAKAAATTERDAVVTTARMEAKRIIEEAAKAAEAERADTTAKTKAEVEKIVTQGKERLVAEKDAMLREVRTEAASLVTLVAEKVLREKLDGKSDAKLVTDALKDVA